MNTSVMLRSAKRWLILLLLLSGDIESNPGPGPTGQNTWAKRPSTANDESISGGSENKRRSLPSARDGILITVPSSYQTRPSVNQQPIATTTAVAGISVRSVQNAPVVPRAQFDRVVSRSRPSRPQKLDQPPVLQPFYAATAPSLVSQSPALTREDILRTELERVREQLRLEKVASARCNDGWATRYQQANKKFTAELTKLRHTAAELTKRSTSSNVELILQRSTVEQLEVELKQSKERCEAQTKELDRIKASAYEMKRDPDERWVDLRKFESKGHWSKYFKVKVAETSTRDAACSKTRLQRRQDLKSILLALSGKDGPEDIAYTIYNLLKVEPEITEHLAKLLPKLKDDTDD